MHDETTRAFNTLLPSDYKEPWKNAMSVCFEEISQLKSNSSAAAIKLVKSPCDLALNIVRCFHKHNPKYTFA